MSYPENLKTAREIQELLKKKEFSQLYLNPRNILKPKKDEFTGLNDSFLDSDILKENLLTLHSHQLFVRNLINPNTPYLRLLLKHSTGSGKTLASLCIAMLFIRYYQLEFQLSPEERTPLVYIIGFSKQIFQKELLKRPEFGFISREEISEYKRLRYLSETGSKQDQDVFIDFEAKIKKRLSRKSKGGFFKFYGYKEFFNRLFIFPEYVNPQNNINQETEESESNLTEDQVLLGLKTGQILINFELLDSFKNSLIICDEIHNVYNSSEMNNYGIALKFLLNCYDSPDEINQEIISLTPERIKMLKNSNIHILLMSATPINNNPTEIIDLINLLIPRSELKKKYSKLSINGLNKDEFFIDNRNLKPDSLDKLQELVRGYISFLRDDNPKYFPERKLDGIDIKIPPDLLPDRVHFYKGTIIPYLKFIVCPMSEYHQITYDWVTRETETFPPDGQTLMDLVLPNPGLIEPKNIGLFRTKDIKYSFLNAPKEWLDKHQISLDKIPNSNNYYLTGEFMVLKNLRKYSTKYSKMMEFVLDNLEKDKGKILINHQYVKMSGILFIQEVLRKNGLIDEYSGPSDDTLCSKCGHTRLHHPRNHEYLPARFIIYHGDIDKPTLDKSLERFKNPENINGYYYRVFIGSKIINEGLDFNAVQNLWVMVVPNNIPTLLQILGRAVRKNSHIGLPAEKNKVNVKIFVSSSNHKNKLSYEEKRYFEKSQDYLIIQQLEKVFNENAIDSVILRNIIMPPEQLDYYKTHREELGDLYFEPSSVFGMQWKEIDSGKKEIKDPSLTTFRIYHSEEEIKLITYIIKRLFIEQSNVFRYEDLWEMVRNPPFELQVNPDLFLEENFIISLSIITESENSSEINSTQIKNTTENRILQLFDHLDKRIILPSGRECKIFFIPDKLSSENEDQQNSGGYYILFPVNNLQSLEEEDNPGSLGQNIATITAPDIDFDNWYRHTEEIENSKFRITKFLKTSSISYNQLKYKFYNQYKDTPIEELPISTEIYDQDFHLNLIEDSIRYVFNILTNPEMPFSEIHDFYFKMLYFYDRLEMVIFADYLENTKFLDIYKNYITRANLKFDFYDEKVKNKNKKEFKKKKEILFEDHQYNPFLMSSILKSSETQVFNINRLNQFLEHKGNPHITRIKKHPGLDDIQINHQLKKSKKISRVFSNMLPVGHLLSNSMESNFIAIPKLYLPELDPEVFSKLDKTYPWIKAYEFIQKFDNNTVRENDLIIGYYEKNPVGIDVKFKLRQPIQKIEKFEDSRMIERGSACTTKKKEELIEIAKLLGIKDLNDENSIRIICNNIKLELMYREMKERRKWKHLSEKQKINNKRIKWFYLHFEAMPE